MSLDIRKKYFKKLTETFDCKKINDLMVEVKIRDDLFKNLQLYTSIYLSKCFNESSVITDKTLLIQKILNNKHLIKNMTPNGMLVPKRELSLDFNNILKSYIKILDSLNIFPKIENFHFPPNIRLKYGIEDQNNLNRAHPTEKMHSDTWTGANPNWIAVHLYILGDIENNHLKYAYPPSDFSEDWLKPVKKAEDGDKFAKKFKEIDYEPKAGSMILADATIIHRSYRKPGAGIRVSLDTGFDGLIPNLKSFKDAKIDNINVTSIRKEETVDKDTFWSMGDKNFCFFPDNFEIHNDTLGGYKHPSNPKIFRFIND